MSDATLTTAQVASLLFELSTNDAFRARFQEKPAAALVELGIPHETVINLKASCLLPQRLAGKTAFKQAHDQLTQAEIAGVRGMIIPHHLCLGSGKPAK